MSSSRLQKFKKKIMESVREQIETKYSNFDEWVIISDMHSKESVSDGEMFIGIRNKKVIQLQNVPKTQTHFVKIVNNSWQCDCNSTEFTGQRCEKREP